MSRVQDLRRFLWLLRTYVAPHWPAVILLLVTSYLATALAALFPVLLAPILDLALGAPVAGAPTGGGTLSLSNLGATFFRWIGVHAVEDRFHAILWLCAAYVIAGFLKGWLDFGNYLLALWIRVRAAAALQLDLFRHLLGLSMRFFTAHRTGELVSRVETDTRSATDGLETIVGTVLTAPVLIAFFAWLMVRTSPRLIGAALGAAVLHFGVVRLMRGPIRRLLTDQFSAFAALAARLQESILSIRVVKSFGAEVFELARVHRAIHEVVRVNVKFGIYKHIEEPARTVVNYLVEATILLLAAWELLAGRLTAPAFFLFLYVGRSVMVQIGLLAGAYSRIQATLAASSRVSQLLDLAPEVKDGAWTIDSFEDRIAVRPVASLSARGERGSIVPGARSVGRSRYRPHLLHDGRVPRCGHSDRLGEHSGVAGACDPMQCLIPSLIVGNSQPRNRNGPVFELRSLFIQRHAAHEVVSAFAR